MRWYVATRNPGKAREFAELLAPHGIEASTWEGYRDPAEGDRSYAENAALKARALAAALRAAGISAPVVADDSGIEVAALGGAPGVLSARFAGPGASWDERRRLVLAAAERTGARGARFVCALHFVADDGREEAVEASVEGLVPPHERGDGGFSYDAVFLYPPADKTFAELAPEQKNAVSHRGRALGLLLARLEAGAREARPPA